jgi:hypothetical protein
MFDLIKSWFGNYSLKRPEFKIDMSSGTGFIDSKPTPEDYVLGSNNQALKMILSEERDYTKWLPPHEEQKRGFDSFACVVFSGLNNLEILFQRVWGRVIDFSDRFQAGMTPVIPNRGTNYQNFWDSVRKNGLVLEEEYPWGGKDGHEYVKRPPQPIIDKGLEFNSFYEIQHEWVDWGGCDPNKLYEALRYGTLQASVNGGATSTGVRNTDTNHSITIYKAVKGVKFGILDHYSRSTYEVPWNFYFGSAKQATVIAKKKIQLVQMPWLMDKNEASKIYATYGAFACHIADEYSWKYGSDIGIWEKDNIKAYTLTGFNKQFTLGKQISFK